MSDIHDLKIVDLEKFLEVNSVKNLHNLDIYNYALSLMKDTNTIYKDVDISIIEWMLAYNALLKKISVPIYTVIDIKNLSEPEYNKLSKSLGLSKNNMVNFINVLKYMHKLESDPNSGIELKSEKFKQDLNRELLNTKIDNKKYYSSEILDLKKNDRLTDGDFNYKVISANKNKVIVDRVDILGKSLGYKTPLSIEKEKYHIRGRGYSNKYYWDIDGKKIKPGILLYDYGPEIDNIDSIYLKYKTLPNNVPKYLEKNYKDKNSQETIYYIKGKSYIKSNYHRNPEINMLVNIKFSFNYGNDYYRDYLISDIIDNTINLLHVGNNDFIDNKQTPKNLILRLVNNEWELENNDISDRYSITIGGFGETDQKHYYD